MNYGLYFQEDCNIHRRKKQFYCIIQPSNSYSTIFAVRICACSSLTVSRNLVRNFLHFREAELCFHLTRRTTDFWITDLLPSRYPRDQLNYLLSERYITIVSPSVRPLYDFCQFYDLIKKNYCKI